MEILDRAVDSAPSVRRSALRPGGGGNLCAFDCGCSDLYLIFLSSRCLEFGASNEPLYHRMLTHICCTCMFSYLFNFSVKGRSTILWWLVFLFYLTYSYHTLFLTFFCAHVACDYCKFPRSVLRLQSTFKGWTLIMDAAIDSDGDVSMTTSCKLCRAHEHESVRMTSHCLLCKCISSALYAASSVYRL